MPIQRRLPKRGFKNHSRVDYDVITLRDLQLLDGALAQAAHRAGLDVTDLDTTPVTREAETPSRATATPSREAAAASC